MNANIIPFPSFAHDAWHKLAARHGLIIRPEQVQLAQAIKVSLVSGKPLVSEAPTGIGKTLAYLVGGIEAARQTGRPLLIGTATVALQQQILDSEIPKLADIGLVSKGKAVLVKGRGRYFCPMLASRMREDDSQMSLYGDNSRVGQGKVAVSLLERFEAGQWDGDRDNLTYYPPGWESYASSSDTCVGQKCQHFDECPYLVARRALIDAEVIVANQNLILTDFQAKAAGEGGALPAADYLVVMDEAHHLPEKAISSAQTNLSLDKAGGVVKAIQDLMADLNKRPKIRKFVQGKGLNLSKLLPATFEADLDTLDELVRAYGAETTRLATLPDALRGPASRLAHDAEQACHLVKTAVGSIQVSNNRQQLGDLADTLGSLGYIKGLLADIAKGLKGFLGNEVRWVSNPGGYVASSPLDAEAALNTAIWENEAMDLRLAFVSATLRDTSGYKRFAAKAAIPDYAELTLPHAFDYGRSLLAMPNIGNPKGKGYRAAMLSWLAENLDPAAGSLVLFNSKRALDDAYLYLKEHLEGVMAQGTMGTRKHIAQHKARIDAGKGSVLLGLQTLAEGLDLPGAYCTHVVITNLPFGTPDSPLEQARQEQHGSGYFRTHLLPDATVKLVQQAGRLIRRHTDTGTLTVLDNRLWETGWGKQMLAALPPFSREALANPRETQGVKAA